MGMDVYGKNPSDEVGKYFRANIWAWGPIHAIVAETCEDLLSPETLWSMSFNDGAGPDDQATCTEMANRIEAWLADQPSDCIGFSETCKPLMRFGSTLLTEGMIYDHYTVSREHLLDWVAFLKVCGGFEVH